MNAKIKKFLLSPFSLLYKLNPIAEQKLMFRLKCGYKLDLDHPKTYNEKVAWIKLYDRNPLIPKLADKFLVRQYIEELGYGDHLPKLYWNGFEADKIPFESFPDRFVVKVTSGSGRNILVKNKAELNREKTVSQLKKWLREKYLPAYGEWHYGLERPRIIVEEFLDNGSDIVPPDYKMMYFNGWNGGDVAFTCLDTGRFGLHKKTLYDHDWHRMDDKCIDYENDLSFYAEKPVCYKEMLCCARELAKPFAHARVDFYVIQDTFYIGEITFFNGAGFDIPSPPEFARQMGDWIILQKSGVNE